MTCLLDTVDVLCRADDKDDTEKYSEIWASQYDLTRRMRRPFGASRAIDYLYTLSFIDKDKIGFDGSFKKWETIALGCSI